jgi:glycosyltransferase involved in cell wall biosynthesis
MLTMMSQSAKPEISIIMPCYNAAAYLEAAVASVRSQTFPAWELIVVDDGSTDASPKLLAGISAQDPRIRVLSQANLGPYPARNLGLKHAQGEFIAFLDADDWWEASFLEKMHRALSASGADLAYCGWQNVGEVSRPPYVPPDYLQEPEFWQRLLKSCPWPIHAALTRRKVLEAVGGFSTYGFTSMDYDLWLKIAALTRNWVRVPEVLAFYRWHASGQISALKWRQVLNSLEVRRSFVKAHPEFYRKLSPPQLRRMLAEPVLKAAYQALWQRDLTSAHRLFRQVLWQGGWELKDLKYLLASLLPFNWYRRLVRA